jgi:23S rRNA (uridine2552-2'-O)-methyltransferase
MGKKDKRWVRDRKKDGYYRKAKREHYRSRAAFKLKQINKRYRLIKKGDTVVDLGCSPGGWSQVAVEIVGGRGTVIGVDIANTKPVEGMLFIRGDIHDQETIDRIKETIPGGRSRAVISDMSPKLTGTYSIDHLKSIELARKALEFAKSVLKPGGCFICKVFMGEEFKELLDETKKLFEFCKAHSPEASRSSSSEIYIVGRNFKG